MLVFALCFLLAMLACLAASQIIDMPWDWPVEVNYHEARAFLNWKGARECKVYRMPTEAEYHRMRAEPHPFVEGITPDDMNSTYDHMLSAEPIGNCNMRYGSSCPVNEFPPSAAGFYDVHGNVWEWVRCPSPVNRLAAL